MAYKSISLNRNALIRSLHIYIYNLVIFCLCLMGQKFQNFKVYVNVLANKNIQLPRQNQQEILKVIYRPRPVARKCGGLLELTFMVIFHYWNALHNRDMGNGPQNISGSPAQRYIIHL